MRGMSIKWERRKKEPSATLFLWEAQIASITKWRQMRGMGIKWERGKKESLARVLNRWQHCFCGKLKSPRWQSEDRWEEWVSNERGGRKNRRLSCFVGKRIFDFGVAARADVPCRCCWPRYREGQSW